MDDLVNAIHHSGLAVVGAEACYKALQWGNAQKLLISKDLLRQQSEKLLQLATSQRIPIEAVENSEKLKQLGGVGALLRYKTPVTELIQKQNVS